MHTYEMQALPLPERFKLLTRAIAPRPIALVSTLSAGGVGNLAPFSYFNLGGANPPSCIICPINNREGQPKDTLNNIAATGEYVINAVSHSLAPAANQCSYTYAAELDEFDQAGLTRVPSQLVKPPRVAESPLAFECRLHTIVPHGNGPLSGNYVIGEILLIHAADEVLRDGWPDTAKLDLVGRLGDEWYCRTRLEDLFAIPRPVNP